MQYLNIKWGFDVIHVDFTSLNMSFKPVFRYFFTVIELTAKQSIWKRNRVNVFLTDYIIFK
jgi:hypothetical protein